MGFFLVGFPIVSSFFLSFLLSSFIIGRRRRCTELEGKEREKETTEKGPDTHANGLWSHRICRRYSAILPTSLDRVYPLTKGWSPRRPDAVFVYGATFPSTPHRNSTHTQHDAWREKTERSFVLRFSLPPFRVAVVVLFFLRRSCRPARHHHQQQPLREATVCCLLAFFHTQRERRQIVVRFSLRTE